MSDFAPPSGPPPPKVPEGWKAVWNDQYKEWFYVNIHTKASQWDRPTSPVYPSSPSAPAGPPPAYHTTPARPVGPEKGNPNTSDDEALARRLQAEEAARAGGPRADSSRGASDSYYNSNSGPGGPGLGSNNPYGTNPNLNTPPPGPAYGAPSPGARPLSSQGQNDGQKRGFLGKLLGGGSSRPQQQQYGYGQQQYGGPPPGQYNQGYYQQPPPQQYMQQQPQKHGLGAGGGALLGAGAGILGGALLMDAFEDHDQQAYDQGYNNGEMADDGGYGGGGDGGDFGGGDGGDFGGGDF